MMIITNTSTTTSTATIIIGSSSTFHRLERLSGCRYHPKWDFSQAAQTATRMPVVNPSAADQTRSHRFCQNSSMYNAPFCGQEHSLLFGIDSSELRTP